MGFTVDERIQSSSIDLGDFGLSRVFLKNEACYPWFILVPRLEGVDDLFELAKGERDQLMDEIAALSRFIHLQFNPDKINVASLGNIVRQLHVHVVGRYKDDPLWPHSIWQEAFKPTPYSPEVLSELMSAFSGSQMT